MVFRWQLTLESAYASRIQMVSEANVYMVNTTNRIYKEGYDLPSLKLTKRVRLELKGGDMIVMLLLIIKMILKIIHKKLLFLYQKRINN